MKRFISMLLITALILTMAAGCGQQEQSEGQELAESTAAASELEASSVAAKETEQDEKETSVKKDETKQANETAIKQTEPATKTAQTAKKETKKETKSTKAKKETKKPSKETNAPTKSKKSIAQSYVGRSVGSLISAIGSPNSRSYAPSCMGEGEDGQLKYSGFTVYTYRENGKETVQSVE